MVAVEAPLEESGAQRLVVVARLLELGDKLLAGPAQLLRGELGPQDDVRQQVEEGVQVARQHQPAEPDRVLVHVDGQRGAQPVQGVVDGRAGTTSRAPTRQLGGEAGQPFLALGVGGRSGAGRHRDPDERQGRGRIDEDQRAGWSISPLGASLRRAPRRGRRLAP